jgi:hypothetical protein
MRIGGGRLYGQRLNVSQKDQRKKELFNIHLKLLLLILRLSGKCKILPGQVDPKSRLLQRHYLNLQLLYDKDKEWLTALCNVAVGIRCMRGTVY